jgi:alpha-galactosidase
MVNPDSDLYRGHPDWVLHMPRRDRTEIRHQLVLNFARADVVAWAYAWLDDLVLAGRVDFLKWDMNRPFTEAGWPDGSDPGRLWFDHTNGVYDVIDRLRAAHPVLRIESCASGGGRADFGVMARTDQIWTSDNTDPVDRLVIQDGFGQIYPAGVMGAWVTESPNPVTGRATPVRFRFHSAMAGVLGLSGDVRRWSAAERAETAELIGAYKQIRHVVQHGELHRLASGQLTAIAYVTDDRSECVVFAWRPTSRHGATDEPVRLRALDPEALYVDDDGATFPGAVLMAYGLDVSVRLPRGDYASTMIHLQRDGRTS